MMIVKKQEAPVGDGWTSVESKLPEQEAKLYLVVQKVDGAQVGGSAFFQQDGNGEWNFNKPEVTHWMEWPKLPKEE